ncbi:NAD(P)H-dependent glycerol-3-phosphate dehydrogenase [Bryobacter aggregatus]|uniref:NAD(P)H-dependent glycerol-3-phosphate dehydrogenase n=1 Tax=Bryobacter aggregatus TaxID=360054 RepID=UPI0004E207F1|nr:NAD(P)H-dependent glycerol-3-phosphate dehydrogenase [Bryobacter aggregatus]
MAQELTILGGGSWGTALAIVLAPRFERIHLWVHSEALATQMQASRVNGVYLPGFLLPKNVLVSPRRHLSPWVMTVVPSAHLRGVLQAVACEAQQPLHWISATKGIEAGSFLRMSQIGEECLATKLAAPPAVLTGPTFAREIAAGAPAAIVAASVDAAFAREVQTVFSVDNLRFYTNSDVTGVELSGALKNVMAIAAGAAEGLQLGSNSMAALITRALAEMSRLVQALGGRAETVSGLAGLGDLVLTCHGQLSRNRRVGVELARGQSLAAILASTPMVAEGVETTATALALAARHGIEMPIAEAVAAMLAGRPAAEVLRQLMGRTPKAEC